MSYATLSDLENNFGADEITQLSDRAGVGDLDPAVVANALTRADSDIDRSLSVLYSAYLPLVVVSDDIVGIACDLARYYLWSAEPSEHVIRGYKEAKATLSEFATGRGIPGFLRVSGPIAKTGGIAIQGSTRAFTDTVMAQALI